MDSGLGAVMTSRTWPSLSWWKTWRTVAIYEPSQNRNTDGEALPQISYSVLQFLNVWTQLTCLLKMFTCSLWKRLWRFVSMWAVISSLTWSSDSCAISGRAVMAAVTLPALRDRPVAGVRTVSSLWTTSQVKSRSFGAVKTCRPQNKHKEIHKHEGPKRVVYCWGIASALSLGSVF